MSSSTAQAALHLADFQIQNDAQLLQDAADELQGIVLADEADPERRRGLRREALEGWLKLFAAIDGSLDPAFDPGDLPLLSVDPLPSDGVRFPPGVDPSRLTDAGARREYEQRIEANRRKAERYTLQTKLRRLDERLTPRLEAFLRSAYSTSTEPEDRREVLEAVQATITSPARAERLRTLI